MWRPKVDTRSLFFVIVLYLIHWGWVFQLNPGLPMWASLDVKLAMGIPCSFTLRAEITGDWHVCTGFTWVLDTQTLSSYIWVPSTVSTEPSSTSPKNSSEYYWLWRTESESVPDQKGAKLSVVKYPAQLHCLPSWSSGRRHCFPEDSCHNCHTWEPTHTDHEEHRSPNRYGNLNDRVGLAQRSLLSSLA